MFDLSKHTMLSFEVTDDCNIKDLHKKCPIHSQKYDKRYGVLTEEKICQSMSEANELNFKGYIEFHHYNEPLLAKDMILRIIQKMHKNRFLLITNGLLLSNNIKENVFLKKFEIILITCYIPSKKDFFKELQNEYPNIILADGELDDRLNNYKYEKQNKALPCKRPFFELPIDHYGNVRLCCFDWKNSIKIGNVNNTSLKDVVLSKKYQNILSNCLNGLNDFEICLRCNMSKFETKVH